MFDLKNSGNGKDAFPRDLTGLELHLLESVLPEKKPGYKIYRDRIERLKVSGYGRFGGGNMVLSGKGTKPDLMLSSSPIFAAGTVIFEETAADIVIHEENDGEIEFDLSFSKPVSGNPDLHELNRWSYSEWIPGMSAPGDGSPVREIVLEKDKFVLAAAPVHQKVWLYDAATGVNHLIPAGNFNNNLMIVKGISDPKQVLRPKQLFTRLDEFKDEELAAAFISYNKFLKRIEIDYSGFEKKELKEKKHFFKFFKRG